MFQTLMKFGYLVKMFAVNTNSYETGAARESFPQYNLGQW